MDIRIHKSTDLAVITGQALVDDIDITSGDMVLIDGNEAITQHVLIRLRFFAEEWFLDSRVGMPYFQQILIKNPDTKAIRAIFIQAITTTPGIDSLDSFDMDFDGPTRRLSIDFVAKLTNSPEPLVFDEELIINV